MPKNIYVFLSRMPKKFLISVQTSIFCELSKSGKIAIIGNMTESKIWPKGSGSNTNRDVKPGQQSNVISLAR